MRKIPPQIKGQPAQVPSPKFHQGLLQEERSIAEAPTLSLSLYLSFSFLFEEAFTKASPFPPIRAGTARGEGHLLRASVARPSLQQEPVVLVFLGEVLGRRTLKIGLTKPIGAAFFLLLFARTLERGLTQLLQSRAPAIP